MEDQGESKRKLEGDWKYEIDQDMEYFFSVEAERLLRKEFVKVYTNLGPILMYII